MKGSLQPPKISPLGSEPLKTAPLTNAHENGKKGCPRCYSERVWEIRRGRCRCARCRYEWKPGLPLQIPRSQWETLLQDYFRGKSVVEIAKRLGLGRQRVFRALKIMRNKIAMESLQTFHINAPAPRSPAAFQKNKIVIFGSLDKRGQVRAQALPEIPHNGSSRFLKDPQLRRNLLCLDIFSLKKGRSPAIQHIMKEAGPLNGLLGFWRYLEKNPPRLKKSDGRAALPLYVAERAWRFNNRFLSIPQRASRLIKLLKKNETH